jgi:hypothetical protein
MSPQILHSLKQVGILIVIAALGIVIENATGILHDAGLSGWSAIVMAGLASALRVVEGWRDSNRAAEGKVIPADVAYDAVNARVTFDGNKFVGSNAQRNARTQLPPEEWMP